MTTIESIRRELKLLLEQHRAEVDRLKLAVDFAAIRQDDRGLWRIPVEVRAEEGDASDVLDLFRSLRRSLESKTREPVNLELEPGLAA